MSEASAAGTASSDAGAIAPNAERAQGPSQVPSQGGPVRDDASANLLPAGPNNSCPAGYAYIQDFHAAGCARRDAAAEKRWDDAKRASDARFNQADALHVFNSARTSECYSSGEKSGASFVTLTVEANGRVSNVELDERTSLGSRTSACLDRTFRALRFHAFQTDAPARFARTFFVTPPGKVP